MPRGGCDVWKALPTDGPRRLDTDVAMRLCRCDSLKELSTFSAKVNCVCNMFIQVNVCMLLLGINCIDYTMGRLHNGTTILLKNFVNDDKSMLHTTVFLVSYLSLSVFRRTKMFIVNSDSDDQGVLSLFRIHNIYLFIFYLLVLY